MAVSYLHLSYEEYKGLEEQMRADAAVIAERDAKAELVAQADDSLRETYGEGA